MTDQELVIQAKAGNKEAFGVLVSRHDGAALRLACRVVGQQEIGRELVQEALLQAYLGLEHLRDESKFGGWLYGIVLNVCRGWRRSQRMNFTSLENLAGGLYYGDLPLEDSNPTPPEIYEQRELHRTIMAAIGQLSVQNQVATRLFYYEQLSVAEIAAILGISVGAVKGRLHKARLQLRVELLPLLPEMGYQLEINKRSNTMIKAKIDSIRSIKLPDSEEERRVIVLMDEAGARAVPIWIGEYESNMIAMAMQGVTVARPMTFDFMLKALTATGATLEQVVISSLVSETFYATCHFRSGGAEQEVDARPSDALALAMRVGCPVYLTEQVFDKAGVALPDLTSEIVRRNREFHPPVGFIPPTPLIPPV